MRMMTMRPGNEGDWTVRKSSSRNTIPTKKSSMSVLPKRMPEFVKLEALNPHLFTIGTETYEFLNGQYFKKVAVLGPGQSFGEIALQRRCRRTANVKTESLCEFIYLNSECFKKSLSLVQESFEQDMVAFLHSLPVFQDLTYKKVL